MRPGRGRVRRLPPHFPARTRAHPRWGSRVPHPCGKSTWGLCRAPAGAGRLRCVGTPASRPSRPLPTRLVGDHDPICLPAGRAGRLLLEGSDRRGTCVGDSRLGCASVQECCSKEPLRWRISMATASVLVALERHGRAGCRDGDSSLGATLTLPASVGLARGSKWHVRLLVRPCVTHRIAKGIDRLDDEGRPLPRSSDSRSAERHHVSPTAARDPRFRGRLRIGTSHG